MAVTLEEKIDSIGQQLSQADLSFGQGVDNPWDEAVWLVITAVGLSFSEPIEEWEAELNEAQIKAVDELAQKRIDTRKPLAYLTNEAWFVGLRFYVDERVLVPRSFLGEWIQDGFEPWVDSSKVGQILDLCTGSACIAIACGTFFDQTRIVASDMSEAALEVAKKNIKTYGLEDRIRLNHGDLFDGIDQEFDLILCNPPYVSDQRMDQLPQEFLFEPDLALRAGSKGLDFIQRLLAEVAEYLTKDGYLLLEAGSASHALEAAYPSIPFTWLSTQYDEQVVLLLSADEIRRYFN